MLPALTILEGDALAMLRTLPDESVHCCVTSPPYWGLRDYGVAGQLGLEPTPEDYVAKMVEVFREVKRVLRDDGTCWCNLGDSYAGSWGNYGGQNRGNGTQRQIVTGSQVPNPAYDGRERDIPPTANVPGLKPKDLVGIPWRLAFAMQADGWYLRQWMPWVKRNSMPESTQDRPVTSCETIFLFTKSARYFYDAEAVKLPGSMALAREVDEGYNGKATKDFASAGAQNASAVKARIIANRRDKQRGHSRRHDGFNDRWDAMEKEEQCNGWRSCRNSDWFFESVKGLMLDENGDPLALCVNPANFTEAHFATFPPGLVVPLILAGSSAKGCCPKCLSPWQRVVETSKDFASGSGRSGNPINGKQNLGASRTNSTPDIRMGPVVSSQTTGWRSGCDCGFTDTVPAVVLDPFAGSGTTGAVALELGRHAVLIELNPAYVAMIRQRCAITPGLQLA